MSKGWTVIRREFTEMVRTKIYIIGTLLGPVLIALLMVGPLFFMRAGAGGERDVVLIDATGTGLGQDVARQLEASGPESMDGMGSRFNVTVKVANGGAESERDAARQRIGTEADDAIDGYLFLPSDFMAQNHALYEGRNATAQLQMAQVKAAVEQAVRARRLNDVGVTPQVLAAAMRGIDLEARKPGREGEEGKSADTAFFLGLIMGMTVYFAVVLFATSIMRGVLEEKRDRIIEVLLSSLRARDLIVGKVLGIGLASLLQMAVWVGFAVAAFTWGPAIAARYGSAFPTLPQIPGGVAVVFLFFFTTGFLLYASMFGAAGAIATTDQEANQMQLPVTIPLLLGIFMMYSLMADPDNAIAVAGSLIPFTAPVVLPVRAMMTQVPVVQYIVAAILMIITVMLVMWMAAKIYRIGVLSTGKRPTLKELGRWLRTA